MRSLTTLSPAFERRRNGYRIISAHHKSFSAQLVALPGANETNTGEVSEIVTVTDGYHFVVASAGVGLFLVSSDPNTNTPIVEARYSMPGTLTVARLYGLGFGSQIV